jgi:MYXO-CTERM domain-containing protein
MTARTKVAPWAGLMMLLWAPGALAQQSVCAADSDCEAGFACEVVGGGSCPTVDCVDGEKCESTCEAEEIMGCVPGPCESDADCGDNQVCYTRSSELCSGSSAGSDGCPPDDAACAQEEPAEDSSCVIEEYSQCMPRWAVPCEEAADCGPGFTCEAIEECSATGGTNTDAPCPEGSECPVPEPQPEPEINCEPTDVSYCKLIETPCVEDSECGDGMVCVDAGGGVTCGGTDKPASGAAGSGGDSDGEPEPADGDSDADLGCEAVAEEPDMLCVPADFESWGSARDLVEALGDGESLIDLDGAASGDDKAGGDATGAPQAPGAADGSDESAADAKDDGCSVSSGRAATSQGLWLLLGVAFLARRRRS